MCFWWLITLPSGGEEAEIAHDKKRHKELFTGDIEFERFYRYLQYASLNTFIHLAEVFWDKMIELLEDDSQDKAPSWKNAELEEDRGGGVRC